MSASTHSDATNADAQDAEAPKIEALFLIKFDKKVGYTIAWKRTSHPSITLENAVEYKSLPSGLHTQGSDLVYFTHEGYAGLSAFARGSAGAEDRNAVFVSVGVLVRREGQLGRGWLVAGRLGGLASGLVGGGGEGVLEEFWEEQTGGGDGSQANGDTKSRERTVSTTSVIPNDTDTLPAYHPAHSLLAYISTFGPLVFRLQQAALLRKRILFVGAPPVRLMCDFVYILSILSSLPSHSASLLLPGPTRLPTLFSVGVHDISELEKTGDEGWAACTTDEIIATKSKLYDIIVDIPQEGGLARMRTSGGHVVRASQRDAERWKMLQRALKQHKNASQGQESYRDEPDSDQAPLIPSADESSRQEEEVQIDDSLIEPTTWSRLAYSGFMWWASAGERDFSQSTLLELDRDLLSPLLSPSNTTVELDVISYFHRLSSTLVEELNRVVEGQTSEQGYDSENEEEVVIGGEELGMLGLDGWSEADRAFVCEFGSVGWGREVVVRGREVECCGLRVPVL